MATSTVDSDDARARDGITNRGKGPECASFLYAKNKEFASLRGCGGLPDQYETEEEIKRYLSYEGTKSYIDDEGGTLLHLIGEFTPLYIIKLLVEGGVPADTPNNIGCTPLVVAVGSKNTAAAEYLISLKANVNVKSGTSSAITLAQIACFNGSPEILKFLVGAGAELFTTNNKFRGILLHTALSERSFSSQSVELIRYLVDDLGSDVNAISSYGIFPVLKAASLQLSKGSPESKILGFLISRKADLNTSDAEGRRAVHIASIGKKSHGLEMLVEAGADINVEDNYGRRPIHFAAGCSQECLEYILDRRVDINVPDHDGWTPLMWAVRSGEEGSIRKLMRMGADIWCRGRGYETEWSALKLARFWDLWEDPDILKLLMPQRSARKTANGRVEEWEKEFHRTHPAHHKMTLCTSCTMEIIGFKWECIDCYSTPSTQLCFKCYGHASTLHDPAHIFKNIGPLYSNRSTPPEDDSIPVGDHEFSEDESIQSVEEVPEIDYDSVVEVEDYDDCDVSVFGDESTENDTEWMMLYHERTIKI